ncbi:MAG: MarR family winged helix-turn-helix transcriptional regulator [Streptosporangiaceae bacterium]
MVGRLFRLAPRLVEPQDLGARQYGLGFARGRVLWALQESGPVLMRALSQQLGISPRTVTGLIDALEADGWVTRSPHRVDRRATIISLTGAAPGYPGPAERLLPGPGPQPAGRPRPGRPGPLPVRHRHPGGAPGRGRGPPGRGVRVRARPSAQPGQPSELTGRGPSVSGLTGTRTGPGRAGGTVTACAFSSRCPGWCPTRP